MTVPAPAPPSAHDPAPVLDLDAFMPYQLSVASNAVSDRIARTYRVQFGLKIPEWRLLAVLGQGTPRTQRDLVAQTCMDKVTVSRASAALVARGVVTRADCPADGRSHRLALTQAGAALYARIAPVALARERALLACLSRDEQAQLAALLRRLRGQADALAD